MTQWSERKSAYTERYIGKVRYMLVVWCMAVRPGLWK